MHPTYYQQAADWLKYDIVYNGGRQFIDYYLAYYTKREAMTDFQARKALTYNPGFARALVDEVKNALYQRTTDVQRLGGPTSYVKACQGIDYGVDRRGSSMSGFIGLEVLLPLLKFGKVGVLVDRVKADNIAPLKANEQALSAPYCAVIDPRNILNWVKQDPGLPGQFKSIKLRECIEEMDDLGFPTGSKERERVLRWTPLGVQYIVLVDDKETDRGMLDLEAIPVVVMEISDSLMRDTADYQIALLNMASADLHYSLKANFPMYTEQRDKHSQPSHFRTGPDQNEGTGPSATAQEVVVGASDGRTYAVGTERPGFIAPPAEPLRVSMEKQEQMKREMRLLMNLTISDIKSVSAQSKQMDSLGLEAGLSFIGLVLEQGERQIARSWADYENAEGAEITYPKTYALQTTESSLTEASKLAEQADKIPSNTYKKEIAKQITRTLLLGKVDSATIDKIYKEIDQAQTLTVDPDVILVSQKQGVISDADAAKALGYPEGTVEQANKDHLQRIIRIAAAQQQSPDPNATVPGSPIDPAAASKLDSQDPNKKV